MMNTNRGIIAGISVMALLAGSSIKNAAAEMAGTSPNYVQNLVSLEHWRHFPVKVFFVKDASYTAARQNAITGGFRRWTETTEGRCSFILSSEPRQADILVRTDPSRAVSITNTQFDPDSHELAHADMTIGLQDADGPLLQLKEVTAVSEHEFGHALGINGHSSNSGDVMFPQVDGNVQITHRDLNTIRAAYNTLFASNPSQTSSPKLTSANQHSPRATPAAKVVQSSHQNLRSDIGPVTPLTVSSGISAAYTSTPKTGAVLAAAVSPQAMGINFAAVVPSGRRNNTVNRDGNQSRNVAG